MDRDGKRAFHLIMKYVNSFPKAEHDRAMFLWGSCSDSRSSAEFTQHFSGDHVNFAILPDTDRMDWDEKTMDGMLAHLDDVVIKDKRLINGTGVAQVTLDGLPLTISFVKKLEKSRGVYLMDDKAVCVNGKHWVQTKLFIYYFLRPKNSPWPSIIERAVATQTQGKTSE